MSNSYQSLLGDNGSEDQELFKRMNGKNITLDEKSKETILTLLKKVMQCSKDTPHFNTPTPAQE